MQDKKIYYIYFIIFLVSGFTGLIYESIWSHYLKLFLGHAAYAQTLVLSIFMGGMAIGSWICSRRSIHWRNLIRAYAMIEAIIGVAALIFHNFFDTSIQLAYNVIIPSLENPALINSFKWGFSAMIILPQSILLGMTFPLMSGGVIRLYPKTSGTSIAMLYFTNSFGAAIGVLASGFILIKLVGLPGTIFIAGVLNLLLATVAWVLSKDNKAPVSSPQVVEQESTTPANWYVILLLVSLFTGMASFIYEVTWIRMLALVLGSSTHAFELMLSAFILGLALGGLWIKFRIQKISNIIYYLAIIQLIMGLIVLSTLPIYNLTFDVMQWLHNSIDKSASGYLYFNLSSHAIAMSIMLPTTICAGMTLPLITYSLLKSGYGEKVIGGVYAFNTVGAIAGILIAVHIGMPYLGLKGILCLGAAIDLALALFLFFRLNNNKLSKSFVRASAIAVSMMAATIVIVDLDHYKMSSSVYRTGELINPNHVELLYHKDGKTSTVDLHRTGNIINIRTNGKVDAEINMLPGNKISPDEPTMVLAATIPIALNPQASKAAVIGMGSGLTTHTLLSYPPLATVDTIEIEQAVVEAANGFRPRVEKTFTDPRSSIHIEDAKTYFSSHNAKYDIIVSEPSNPWVSGIASLFTQEYYRTIPAYLSENGIYAQWVQLYELNVELVATIVKALTLHFDDYAIYMVTGGDLLIVAKKTGQIPALNNRLFQYDGMRQELQKINIKHIGDLDVRRIGSKKVLDPLFQSYPIPANSDYYPVLDLNAAYTRFLQSTADEIINMGFAGLPVSRLLEDSISEQKHTQVTISTANHSQGILRVMFADIATTIRDSYHNDHLEEVKMPRKYKNILIDFNNIFKHCKSAPPSQWIDSLIKFSDATLPYLSVSELDTIWLDVKRNNCYPNLARQQQDWVSLLHALSQRNGENISTFASRLISLHAATNSKQYWYLIFANMLGEIMNHRPENALAIWNQFKNDIDANKFNDLQLRLLVSLAGGI